MEVLAMHGSTVPDVSNTTSSTTVNSSPARRIDDGWEQWDELVIVRADEIAEQEGIPHEVAYHVAQQQLAPEVGS